MLPVLAGPHAPGGSLILLSAALCRLDDNPALNAASRAAGPVSFAFIAEDSAAAPAPSPAALDAVDTAVFAQASDASSWPLGRACRAFLHRSLRELDADVRRRQQGSRGIIFRRGDPSMLLPEIARVLGVARVLCAIRYEPTQRQRDEAMCRVLSDAGFEVVSFPGFLMHSPEEVKLPFPGKWVGHYGTLTPFVAACRALGEDLRPLPEHEQLPPAHSEALLAKTGGVRLEDLGLDDAPGRWSDEFERQWRGFGESAARRELVRWTRERYGRYERDRSRADSKEAVSRLSPYLRLGIISPRRVMEGVQKAGGFAVSKTAFRRLYWRDLAYWQLHQWPTLSQVPLRPAYARQRWMDGLEAEELLEGWRRGKTGFPLVDAAMRELAASGYISQSVRMAAAAYLVDYCNIDWREGARHFHDWLVDGDLAINGMMWQNAAK